MVTLCLQEGNKITQQELHTAGWALADPVHTQIKRELHGWVSVLRLLNANFSQPKPNDDDYVKLFDDLY
jgi:hypothetical protein